MFQDREDAARQLANRLESFRGKTPLVLAIPRGAVPMGKTLARLLQGDFDVVLVRKLRAPCMPELAIGAIAENGWSTLAPYAAQIGADPEYIDQEKQRQLQTLQARRAAYSPMHSSIDPAGRVVIVVDDGLATGSTMIAALHSVRQRQPALLVCAVPVSSRSALEKVQSLADEVVCLHAPQDFDAVGQFYREFPQVEDDEVIAQLKA